MRKLLPGAVALALVAALFAVARLPHASAAQRAAVAARFHFTELPVGEPPGLAHRTIRAVNPAYEKIRAWISSVGAGVAINDLTGTGRPDDMCLVDTRSDSVIVTPVPGTAAAGTYRPFVLMPRPALPYDARTMAPMGCVPGDFNADGRMDLLVHYWGRTPVIFQLEPGAARLSPRAYRPVEVVPAKPDADGRYRGPLWNTNAMSVADFDGDGHADLFAGNYFPDSPVLDARSSARVVMQANMSHATNAGRDHILRWSGTGRDGSPRYTEAARPFPGGTGTGWTLAAATAPLDDSLLPDLYVANDFGHDHLFVNVSTPGHVVFREATGSRTPTVPKSKVLGNDSFKGMGADFADLNGDGRLDIFASNIATSFGLQESNFAWLNTARDPARMRRDLLAGRADFADRSMPMGLAQSGWGWDAKVADFANSGSPQIVQATGFVKSEVNRWAQLQELAMTNDNLLSDPAFWPNVQAGDDIAGHQCPAFYARGPGGPGGAGGGPGGPGGPGGRFVNVSAELGLCTPTPTRGIATADTRGNGATDFAIARQWGPPAYYQNNAPGRGHYLELRLLLPAAGPRGGLRAPGTPATGALVRVTTATGRTMVGHVDGGSGHTGKRDFGLHFGLGSQAGPVTVRIAWRDAGGTVRHRTLRTTPGSHTLLLRGVS